MRESELKPLIRHDILNGNVQVRMGEHSVDSSLDEVFHPVTTDRIPMSLFQLSELLTRGALKLLV